MKKQAMTMVRKQVQAGFTLIELIVVIVILGILAATALPKFASLGGDARAASLNAAKGALASTSAMVHGQWLVDTTRTSLTYEGQTVGIANGYMSADANTALAAGLTVNDYTATVGPAAATANNPQVLANNVLIQPKSIATTPTGLTCYINYAQATSTQNPPVITMVSTNCGQ